VTYLRRGQRPAPMPRGTRAPAWSKRQSLRVTEDRLDVHFLAGGELDADLDSPEDVASGRLLLPRTGWISGRASAPHGH
jgi:hypothetical protein